MITSVGEWLSGYTMDEHTRAIVDGISDSITMSACKDLGAQFFAAELFAWCTGWGKRGCISGYMCCGSHVFALFPFSILDTAGEGRLLAVYFSSYCDGMLHLSCSAQKICLIGSEDLRHRYVVMNVLEMRVPPPPRFEGDLPVLTGEELECWILDHCSV